jgi:hypothetical protein
MYSQEMLQQLQGQGMTTEMLALSGAVQYGILYGVILGAIGLLISRKVGLWKEFRFDKKRCRANNDYHDHKCIMLIPWRQADIWPVQQLGK